MILPNIIKVLIAWFLSQTVISCKHRDKEAPVKNFLPKITKVIHTPVPVDSVVRSHSTGKSVLKKKIAGTPLQVTIANNVYPARPSKSILAGKPKVNIPGKETFRYPSQKPVMENPVVAKMPETFIVKEMTYKVPNPYSFASFGKSQGLKSGIVTNLLQDSIGNIWICTSAGVTKYDGRSFSNFTMEQGLPHNDIRCALQDHNGNIWFGTMGGGVSKYDGHTFTNFTVKDGLCSNYVVSGMAEDTSGNIWMGTWGGVSKYDRHSFTNFTRKEGLINDSVETVMKDRSGNLWFGTTGGVSKYDGYSFTNYTTNEGLSLSMVLSILEDKNGRIWMGTWGGGISIFNGSSFEYYTINEGLINNEIQSLLEDKQGNIWIGTRYGLVKYDGRSFTNFTEQQGLNNDNIYCMLEDRTGNIWIGTGSGGVSKYSSYSFTHITENEGLRKNYIFSTYEDREGKLWFGSWRGGVSQYDRPSIKTFTEQHGLPSNDIRSIHQDKEGNFWFATHKGVAKYDGKSFIHLTEKEGLVNNDVNSITEDNAGNLWFGTEKGISKYNGNLFINYFQDITTAKRIYSIKQDHNGIFWFATSEGVFKYDGHSITHLGNADGSLYASASCIYEDRSGALWFGTEKGVFKYDGDFATRFTEEEGLIYNDVASIVEDSIGNMWFGTRFGLSKLSPERSALFYERQKSNHIYGSDVFFKNYGYADGFLGISCNVNAMLQSKDGNIWIGTNGGITLFEHGKEMADAVPFSIEVSSLRIADQTIDWADLKQHPDTSFLLNNGMRFEQFRFNNLKRWTNSPEGLSLAYNNNYVGFEFIACVTDQPQHIKYQYQLEGLDKNMSALTSQPTASYGNLSPGNYTFKVRAMNYRGDWSNEYKYSFTIRPPWWQTWWFRTGSGMIFIAAVFFVSRSISNYQLRKQKHLLEKELLIQQERQRISSDLHDEIGSTLSSISIYTGLAKKEINKEPYLESIGTNVNEVVNKLDDLVWRINPQYDTLGSVMYRLMVYAEPITSAQQINLVLDDDETLRSQKLPADTKHHIFMILKELVNNAVKHSGCSNIKISFLKQDNYMQMVFEDNGKGFDPSAISTQRNGLNNITHRVNAVKGTMDIKSGRGDGAQIIIRIPLS